MERAPRAVAKRALRAVQALQSNVRLRHMSRRTEAAYLYWTKRFIRFCGLRLPVVLTSAEVHLLGLLLYGGGLRPTECLTLRVKDVDLGRREPLVRRGKAGKDRIIMLP